MIKTDYSTNGPNFLTAAMLIIAIALTSGLSGPDQDSGNPAGDEPELWVGAYLASWEHFAPPTGNWGRLPTDQIDWSAFTHLYYFALNVRADGSLSEIRPYENMGPDRIREVVAAAQKSGTPVLFSVGGWGNYEGFSNAIKPGVRETFITNLISIMEKWGFDGIDLDMEPIKESDIVNYKEFVRKLYDRLQQLETPQLPRPLLTAATAWKPEMYSEIQSYFDQINLMTYDLSGAWGGWVSWHNSPVYSGGYTFPGRSRLLPSVDRMVRDFLGAGVKAEKLGIGIDFYGYVWQGGVGTETGGVTRPNQSWTRPPEFTDNVPYHQIMDRYYKPEYFRWDEKAQAAYLSIDNPGSANDKFISYEEERAIQKKVKYAREYGLGGVFIWELSGGYLTGKPEGERDPLLQAVKQAVNGTLILHTELSD